MQPKMPKSSLTGKTHLKLRWVKYRWKPRMMPRPVSTYMTTNRTRSSQSTPRFQKMKMEARANKKGAMTVTSAMRRSRLGGEEGTEVTALRLAEDRGNSRLVVAWSNF